MKSYQEAGVDLDAAERHVAAISNAVTATWTKSVVGMFGGFAAGVEIPAGYRQPVLMMSTDGVGTKLDVARRTGRWDGIGFDLVAMCVDDLAAVGARPLGFVDYMAVGSLQPDRDTKVVESISRACVAAGCALLGGETAEHPGVMARDAIDLAGAVMGVVEKTEQLGPHLVEDGDIILGLPSANLRSNGFSLVRALLGDDIVEHADTLLEPSIIYSPSVLRAIEAGGVHAAAHITGGGIGQNLDRVLPRGLSGLIETESWEPPPVFRFIEERGVDREEMLKTFNMGIGFCLVVDGSRIDSIVKALGPHDPLEIRRVTSRTGVRLR